MTFGIVIPTHDRERWVVESVESVLAQDRPPDQIVVVDDGSGDDTAIALERFGERIRVLRQDRSGPAAAKNRGVRATATSWIVFLDSDDRLVPHALQLLERAIAQHGDHDLLAFRARETSVSGSPTARVVGKRSSGPAYSTAGLLRHDAGGCSWFAVRRNAFEAVGGFDENLRSAEECDLVLRLSEHHRLSSVPEALVLRRMHAGMLSADRELNARCWIRILQRMKDERPNWVRRHRDVFDRSWSKEHLRLGRALLTNDGPDARIEARRALRVATEFRRLHLRSWLYRARAAWISR